MTTYRMFFLAKSAGGNNKFMLITYLFKKFFGPFGTFLIFQSPFHETRKNKGKQLNPPSEWFYTKYFSPSYINRIALISNLSSTW